MCSLVNPCIHHSEQDREQNNSESETPRDKNRWAIASQYMAGQAAEAELPAQASDVQVRF